MLHPDFKEFSRLAREATLVPVVKSVSADLLTPVSAFLAIAEKEPHAFLLESVAGRFACRARVRQKIDNAVTEDIPGCRVVR